MNAWWRAALAVAMLAWVPDAAAQVPRAEASEAGVKAAFLYKFANYIEWPAAAFATPSSPLVIGVAGSDEVHAELERIAPGRSVNGHPIVAKRLAEGDVPTDIHMLFIGRRYGAPQTALRAVQSQPVLTVTESDRAFENGSAINFVAAGDRVGFEVSVDAAEKSGLRISARMLAVARRVIPRA